QGRRVCRARRRRSLVLRGRSATPDRGRQTICQRTAARRDPARQGRDEPLAQRVRVGQLEFLNALGVVDLAGIDVARFVDCHGVYPVELAGIAAAAAEVADHAAVLALENADFVVLAVGIQQIGLFRVGPDGEIPDRAIAERVLLVEPFLDEGAVLLEHLDAVLRTVADVDQAVIGDLHAMHGIAELLLYRRLR